MVEFSEEAKNHLKRVESALGGSMSRMPDIKYFDILAIHHFMSFRYIWGFCVYKTLQQYAYRTSRMVKLILLGL